MLLVWHISLIEPKSGLVIHLEVSGSVVPTLPNQLPQHMLAQMWPITSDWKFLHPWKFWASHKTASNGLILVSYYIENLLPKKYERLFSSLVHYCKSSNLQDLSPYCFDRVILLILLEKIEEIQSHTLTREIRLDALKIVDLVIVEWLGTLDRRSYRGA
jgi:hypothetical protein